jgi:hypothetical protein
MAGESSKRSNAHVRTDQNDIALLLQSSTRAVQAGNRAGALALLRTIVRQYPDEVQAWQQLAEVSDYPDEQSAAREQVRRLTHPASSSPTSQPRIPAGFPWPAFAVASAALVVLILLLLNPQAGILREAQTETQAATPTANTTTAPTPQAAAEVPISEEQPTATATATPTATLTPTDSATPTATTTPEPETLAMGTVLSEDNWHATLLRPDYAQMLSDPIGDIQPQGQFALALMAVRNTAAEARRIPPEIFTLVDDQGRTYSPLANASSTYLSVYGRGEYGDLAYEDAIPADGGMRSVPLIFDVAPDVNGLMLTFGEHRQGWPVLLPASQNGEAPQTPTPNAAP